MLVIRLVDLSNVAISSLRYSKTVYQDPSVTRLRAEPKIGWILDRIMPVRYNSWCSEFLNGTNRCTTALSLPHAYAGETVARELIIAQDKVSNMMIDQRMAREIIQVRFWFTLFCQKESIPS